VISSSFLHPISRPFNSFLQNHKHPFLNTPPDALPPTHLTMPVVIFDTRHRQLREFIQSKEIKRQGDLASNLPFGTVGER
jgi:hypothetical protein